RAGAELYRYRDQPAFKGPFNQLATESQVTLLPNYPADGRESVVAPVFAASTPTLAGQRALVLVLSHIASEGQENVFNTLRVLLFFGLGIAGVIVLAGLIGGRYLLRENERRQLDAQRRSTIRTLLTTSRALNSTLDLKRVLALILEELGH